MKNILTCFMKKGLLQARILEKGLTNPTGTEGLEDRNIDVTT
jgi:hypothetical protein